MSRNGFALLAVLWLLTLAGSLVALAVRATGDGVLLSRNRVALTRAEAAMEACLEITRARFAVHRDVLSLDTVDLGGGIWCVGRLEDPQARINLNLADSLLLRAILGADTLVSALLDWLDADSTPRAGGAEAAWYLAHGRPSPRNGPLADVREVRLVRGFEDFDEAGLQILFTVHGDGRINPRTAHPRVLVALGYSPEAIGVIEAMRTSSAPRDLPEGAFPDLRPPRYQDIISFRSDRLVGTAEGGVRGEAATSRVEVLLGVTNDRLATLGRAVR